MKIAKKYVLYINSMDGTADYCVRNSEFDKRITANATVGKLFDCTFAQLKYNLKFLQSNRFNTQVRK